MAAKSELFLLGNSSATGGKHFQVNQLSFAHSNSGHNLWRLKELPSLRRAHTKLRAERTTRRPPQEDSDSWKQADREEYNVENEGPNMWDSNVENIRRRREEYNVEKEGPNMWDSNVENIRRRRSKRIYYSRPEVDEEAPSPSLRERNNWSEDSMWDYETDDAPGNRKGRWGFDRSDRSENSEWDYESEAPRAKTRQGWQWWFDDNGDDDYEEEKEDYQEEDNWLSWLSADVKDAFLLLRWGLPAAFLLCTAVLPVMLGNPLILLFGFCVFPTVVKSLSPVVKDVYSSVVNPFGSSSSKRTKRRTQPASTYSRRSQDTAKYTSPGSPPQPSTRSYESDGPRQKVPSQRGSLGGWDDLVDDRSRFQAESQWPLQRRAKSGSRLVKREQPLVIRIILAFFPFLRGWGGLF